MKKFLLLLVLLLSPAAHAQGVAQNPNLFWATPTSGTGFLKLRQISALDFNGGSGATGSTCLSGLLTWVACAGGSGGGTVNSGTANQLAYYAATGAAVSGLATANSAVLQTNGSGVPSFVAFATALANMDGAPLASPAFTGVPTGPTAALGTSTAQLATTAFVLANTGSGASSSINLDSFVQAGDTSDCAAFQRAYDSILATGGIINLPARKMLYGTVSSACQTVMSGGPVIWQGTGFTDANQNKAANYASWIEIVNPTLPAFLVNSTNTNGMQFRDLAVSQADAQTIPSETPGVPWTPAVFPFVFDVYATGGTFIARNVMLYAVYRGFNIFVNGRTVLDHISGQVFDNVVTYDRDLDTQRAYHWQIWPFWSYNANVQKYMNTNLDCIRSYRNDGPTFDDIFCISARSVIRFGGSTGDILSGVTSRAHLGTIQGDGSGKVIWVDATGSNTSFKADYIDGQHIDNSVACCVSIVGSNTIQIDSGVTSVTAQIGQMRSEWAAQGAINVLGNNTYIDVSGSAWIDRWANDGGGEAMLNTGPDTNTTIRLGLPPISFYIISGATAYGGNGKVRINTPTAVHN